MAVDMFIKIEGLDGEAQDKVHKGEIDVLAWSWGMSNSGSAHVGGGQGAGKVNVQDLSFTKWVDKSSPMLMEVCCNGKNISKATLVVRKSGGAAPVEYLTLTMDELIVTSVSTGGSGGEDRLTENVSLNFAKFHIKYIEQKPDGGEGAKPETNWNIQQNAKE